MSRFALMLAWGVLLARGAAEAQEPARLALLIGNKGYTPKVGPLKNPHNDVDLIGAALTRLGFKVTVLKDASYKQMDTALKRYVTDVRRAGRSALSFFYYSGHGVANPESQINYLIPVDVADADDDKVWFESFQQNAVIDLLSKQASAATHYLVFDACRNELNVSGPNAKALGSDKGFVPVADTSGLLIAYATAPKHTASDVGEGGGPYAKVLAEELVKPGVEAVSMFRNVQIRVKQSIGQDPWLSFPSLPPVYLAGRSAELAAVPAASPSQPAGAAEVVRVCREVEAMTSLSMLAVLERQHAGTPAADCISARIGELKAAQAAAAKTAEEKAKADTKRAEEEARAKAEAERQKLAMLEQQRQDEARKAAEAEAARRRTEAAMTPGTVFRDCPDCPEMVVVPAGSFMMGSPAGEASRSYEEGPQRKVTIAKPFAVGKFEVTFAEWDACVTAGGRKHKPEDQGW